MGKSTLYETKHKINDFITIRVPTIKDIIENEDDYYGNVALIVATPYDMMVQLDDMKIDFTQINEWDLFLLLFNELRTRDLSLIFDGLDLRDFVTAENKQNGTDNKQRQIQILLTDTESFVTAFTKRLHISHSLP